MITLPQSEFFSLLLGQITEAKVLHIIFSALSIARLWLFDAFCSQPLSWLTPL
jgi:hypothetical protein